MAEPAPRWRNRRLILRACLVAGVLAYGALLRFDAITLKYGPVERPALLKQLQDTRAPSSALRPPRVTWQPVPLVPHRDGPPTKYGSDPYTYLQYARQMRSFYAAHRREPLFPFATKAFLWLLDGQDVAVSFASASFSLLVVLATFVLGAYAFSYWVGLGAALGMAIEYDVVSWGVGGWRDDAFTLGVLLFALALLRYARAPGAPSAMLAGAAAGLACLVRITALSFVVPGFAWLWFCPVMPWRAKLRHLAAAVAAATVLVGPYLVNCWMAFGDPFHSINVHADVYRAAEGQAIESSQTAGEYLRAQWRSHPVRTLDTVVLGMTSYPFGNKWRGFEPWVGSAGRYLSWAAIAGMIVLLASGSGRLFLLVLAASLVPYAATWRLISDWRFTGHAYPFLLLAACLVFWQVVALAGPRRARAALDRITWKGTVRWGLVLAGLGLAIGAVVVLLPLATVREALDAGEAATIAAGPRDEAFFAEGWSRRTTDGNVTTRTSRGPRSTLRIPLPGTRAYDLMVRMDPVPRPRGEAPAGLPVVRLFMNGAPLDAIPLTWNQARVGAYATRISAPRVRAGLNRLAFVVEPTSVDYGAVRVWYVRVTPAPP